MALASRSPVRMRTTCVQIENEYLSVAHLAGFAPTFGSPRSLIYHGIRHRDLYFCLRHELHHILGAAINLGVPALPAEAADLGDGQPLDPDSLIALRTSSSLNGLMMAVMSFIATSGPLGAALAEAPVVPAMKYLSAISGLRARRLRVRARLMHQIRGAHGRDSIASRCPPRRARLNAATTPSARARPVPSPCRWPPRTPARGRSGCP